MIHLLETLVAYARFALLLCCLAGTLYHGRLKEKRRPFLYIGCAFLVIYMVDMLRFLEILPLMEERMYRALRTMASIGALNIAMWSLLLADLAKIRDGSGMRWWGLGVLLLLLTGCVAVPHGDELSSYASRLNERNVASCIWWSGHLSAYLSIQGVTATGGMPLTACDEIRR